MTTLGMATPAGTDAAADAPADTSWGAKASAWLADVPWFEVIVAVVVLALLLLVVWLILRRQRSRSADVPRREGPSLARRLHSVWAPFYVRIPRRALHYPTVVVMGEAGVGKSHLIDSRVDWRGQANRFNPSANKDPVLLLYLGADVVVHEVSAPLLRDVSSAAKRALTQLWRNMGPSAIVVVVLDARTLATTPPSELQALAQLVSGKIDLFPRRVSDGVDIRVCLTHLDQVEGYEEFAAVVGVHEKGLELGRMGPDYEDADALVAAFDEHLAYALTNRTGDEFTRLVRFYDALAALLGRLHPLLTGLRGEQWYATKRPPSELYLGSIIPHSHVGDPFETDTSVAIHSIGRYNRRTIAGAVALGVGSLAVLGTMAGRHVSRIDDAEAAVEGHQRKQDAIRSASSDEREAAESAADAIERMYDSEQLWLRWVQVERKREITDRFEREIRTQYLLPWLEDGAWGEHGADRVKLLYAISLLYATRDGELGQHIEDNAVWWAKELGLSEQIVTYYVEASREAYHSDVALPSRIDEQTGREWIEYHERMCEVLGRERGMLSPDELEALRARPELRSQAEYEAIDEARKLLLADDSLSISVQPILGELDAEVLVETHGQIAAVSDAVVDLTEDRTEPRDDWGLCTLVVELEHLEQWKARHQDVSATIDDTCKAPRGTAVATMTRQHAHELVGHTLESISDERSRDGLSFFDAQERIPDVGAIHGYGGGATTTISGYYTKSAFEDRVEPVLRYAAETLPRTEVEVGDRDRLDRAIKNAVAAYASAYRDELITYYLGFEFDPGSKVALPFALKALTQPSSWFTDFLTTVSRNAALPLLDDEYHAPLRSALEVFAPLVALLAEEDGAIAGLEPYTAIITDLLPLMDGTGDTATAPAGEVLEDRLSGLGKLTLQTLLGKEIDRRVQVGEWLDGAQLDYQWHHPFERPVDLVYAYGLRDLDAEVSRAWTSDVRPVVTPLLAMYPFDGAAEEEAQVAEIESRLRKQGEPGELWVRFDKLLGPVTQLSGDRYEMLPGVHAPTGMLELLEDVQSLSATLWDKDGGRIPLKLVIEPQALSTKPYEGRVASMAYLSSGGSAVYAFNQRPEPQLLELRWWDQGASVVSLTMTATDGEDERESTVDEVGSTFSFYRLVDQGRSCVGKACAKRSKENTPTRLAIAKGTRCGKGAKRGTTDLPVSWSVPVDDLAKVWRPVRFVLVSDPWAPFAVRDCR